MKKTYRIEDLDCAHCAAKMEAAIAELEGVTGVRVDFLTQKLTLEGRDEDFPALAEAAARICRKVEPDCRLVLK